MKIYKKYIKPFLEHPLNRKNKVGAIVNFIKWQLLLRHANASSSYVIAPYIGGLKCIIKKGLTGMTGNLYSGLHEFEEMGFLLHILRKDDFFFDIGSNIGIYTLLASGIKEANSFSFEPVQQTYQLLKSNIAINNLETKATPYNVGVGSNEGLINFSADLDTTNHAVGAEYDGKIESVKVIRLDNEFAGKIDRCTVFKIDTEGFEDQVLTGAEKMLENRNLKAIIVEMNKPELIHAIVSRFDFKPCSYDVFNRKLTPVDFKSLSNVIYVRDKEFVENRLLRAERIQVKGFSI